MLLIGVDSMEVSLVQQGFQEGWLPTLKQVADSGSAVTLSPPVLNLPGALWPSTITGALPHEHLATFDRQLAPGSYEIEDIYSDRLLRPPFWRYISDAGITSTIASVYANRILRPFNGTQVVGYGAYDPFSTKARDVEADPPEALEWVKSAAPGGRSGFLPAMPRRTEQFRFYLRHCLRQIRLQTRALETLMAKTDWDFFFGGYPQAHEAGHLLWHLEDPACPEHPPGLEDELRNALRSVYRAIDEGIGSLLSRRPGDAAVFVLTPHGMRPHSRIYGATDRILERGGWLVRQPARGNGWARRVTGEALGFARQRLPLRARWAIGRLRSRARFVAPAYFEGVDWNLSRAFPLPHDSVSLVRLNRNGREPAGIVPPDVGRELMQAISAELAELRDAESDEPLLEEALVTEDVIGGEVGDVLPDLVARWKPVLSRRVRSPGLGMIEIPMGDVRTGDHRPLGFLIGMGAGIPSDGRSGSSWRSGGSLINVAPTMLARLGVPKPPELTGEAIERFADPATSA